MAYFKFTSGELWREYLRWDGDFLTSSQVRQFRNHYLSYKRTGVAWMPEGEPAILTVPVIPYVEVRYIKQTYLVDTLTNDVCRQEDKKPVGKVGVGYFKCLVVPAPPLLPPIPPEEIDRIWNGIVQFRNRAGELGEK
jgi:hypothetical protein